jgi:hypothetical protein
LAQAEAVNSPVRERWSLNKNNHLRWRKVASGHAIPEREAPFAHEIRTDNSQLSHTTSKSEEAILGMRPGTEGVAIRQEMVEQIAGQAWQGTNAQRTVPLNHTISSR